MEQVRFYYKNHSLNRPHIAPLILLKYYFKTHKIYGYDIYGVKRFWSINIFSKKMRQTILNYFKLHKNESNIRF